MATTKLIKPAKSKTKKTSKPKVRAIKTTIDGIIFDSKLEADYYEYLKQQKEKGNLLNFEVKPEKFTLVPAYVKDGRKVQAITYTADYKIIENDETCYYVDTKGRATEEFKLKRKMFDYIFPDTKLVLITYDYKNKQWVDYDTHKKQKSLEKRRATLAKKKAAAEK